MTRVESPRRRRVIPPHVTVKRSRRIEHGATLGLRQPYSPVPGGPRRNDAQPEHGQRANSRLKRQGYDSPANMR